MEATPKLDARGRKLLRIIAKAIIGMKLTMYRRGPDGTMIEVKSRSPSDMRADAFAEELTSFYRRVDEIRRENEISPKDFQTLYMNKLPGDP